MSDRTIWIVRIVAILVFLLLAWVMLDLHAKLRRMSDERERASLRLPRAASSSCAPSGSSSRAA